MTEAPQKATTKDTVNQISRALNNGARMILEQPFASTYIPNKDALNAWRHRADTRPMTPIYNPVRLEEG